MICFGLETREVTMWFLKIDYKDQNRTQESEFLNVRMGIVLGMTLRALNRSYETVDQNTTLIPGINISNRLLNHGYNEYSRC